MIDMRDISHWLADRGRDEETGLLRRAWQSTKDEGHGQVVTISGETGLAGGIDVMPRQGHRPEHEPTRPGAGRRPRSRPAFPRVPEPRPPREKALPHQVRAGLCLSPEPVRKPT
jgi:hypothetical protein